MKNERMMITLAGLLIFLSSCCCKKDESNKKVLSQRYIHKYGYTVSQEEWESKNYPGQVITSLEDGVMVTATYENGMLHGPMTFTFPHSQTVENYHLYNWGNKVKEIQYNTLGMPLEERIQLSPTRYSVTTWYSEGSPKYIEEFAGDELLEGQYYTTANEIEARVERGRGLRLHRDAKGILVSKEIVENGKTQTRETFYPSGAPESLAVCRQGKLHGQKSTFAPTGEPLAVEEYVNGELHGISTFFQNGAKFQEISFVNGQKTGIERHFIDGQNISQEISWERDIKHGPTTIFFAGRPEERQWYFGGKAVSKKKFEELNELEGMIGQFSAPERSDILR